MELSKYQWFQEQPQSECGFCDRLLKFPNTGEIGDTVQVSVDTGNEFTETFNANPFDLITSSDLTFKITFPVVAGVMNLYIDGKTYVISIAAIATPYELVNTIGNIYFYNYRLDLFVAANMRADFLTFLNEVIDVNHSTTSSMNGGTYLFTVANIPAGSYINDGYGTLNTIGTTTSSTNISKGFYWNGSSVCYYQGIATDFEYKITQTLSSGIDYILKIPYTASYTGYEYLITITDGVNTLTTTGTLDDINGEISYNFTAPSTDSYTITFELTETNDTTEGFCIKGITVDYIDSITDVTVEDCDGNITDVDYSVTYHNNQAIIQMDNANYYESTLPTVFRFKIEDQNNNTIVSRWYELYDEYNCEHQKYTKITWSNSCNLGELLYDYSLLNELYFSGVLIKQGLEIHDSADNVTADGRKISIFKITQPAYELRLAPYLSETMDMIERIFEHDTVLINDVEYNATDVFQVSELDMGVYTGRVDLLKSGDSLVSVKCCS